MKTRTSFFTISILSILLAAFSLAAKSQNSESQIVKQDRTTTEFKGIKASNAVEVFLTQSDKTSITVETYSDKQEIVKTEVKDGILKIFINGKFNRNTSPKVYVSCPKIEFITGSKASSVKCETAVKSEKLNIDFGSAASLDGNFEAKEINCDFSSGASAKITVATSELYVKSSSGSSADLIGTTDKFLLESSSGSQINAFELNTKKCTAKVSSGSEVNINVDEELIGDASSGSQITFKGNAKSDLCSTSSGAEISRKQ
jgi:hypothetical protein